MDTTVKVEHEGPVTVVTIDRPARRNAVDPATAAALLEAFTAFDGDEASTVAVLTGAGETFCAGADLKSLADGDRHRVACGSLFCQRRSSRQRVELFVRACREQQPRSSEDGA